LFPGHWTVLPSDTILPETVQLSAALFNALGLFQATYPLAFPGFSMMSFSHTLIQRTVQVRMKEGGGG